MRPLRDRRGGHRCLHAAAAAGRHHRQLVRVAVAGAPIDPVEPGQAFAQCGPVRPGRAVRRQHPARRPRRTGAPLCHAVAGQVRRCRPSPLPARRALPGRGAGHAIMPGRARRSGGRPPADRRRRRSVHGRGGRAAGFLWRRLRPHRGLTCLLLCLRGRSDCGPSSRRHNQAAQASLLRRPRLQHCREIRNSYCPFQTAAI
ncbi:hypothetical protein CBM2586_A120188 [Cupriavidus phytorum]|uniref:Uncharacterized protein n=1 Tax=Cupriavidus taiwanensis TaxID=164546 RepID=A0A975X6Y5_9BURK|nr:hypothetical protein CBM2586_A120188 [Cupriavidus taiwanensis]